ncbi:MAG: hypothetical protein ACLGIV_07230, partial [Actinomycetes bacterium]
MSTTQNQPQNQPATDRRLTPTATAIAVAGVVVGAVVWAVGLPGRPSLFGTPLADLTVPAALLAVLAGLWVAGWTSTARPRWRVVDIVVASVLGVAGGFLFVAWNVGWEPV